MLAAARLIVVVKAVRSSAAVGARGTRGGEKIVRKGCVGGRIIFWDGKSGLFMIEIFLVLRTCSVKDFTEAHIPGGKTARAQT